MEIKRNNSSQTFGALYVNSPEAAKLLKKADRVVKAARNTVYVDINIPQGHRIPLWSVLSEHVRKRQQNNHNNIIIDIIEKGKQLLSVKTLDSKGFLHKQWVVNPMPVFGRYDEIFPAETIKLGRKSASQTIYGRSAFFDVIDSAEADVEFLQNEEKLYAKDLKVSIKEFPKIRRKNKTRGKFIHFLLKKKANIPHVQRPFIKLKDMLFDFTRPVKSENPKPQPKLKSKLPRHKKKELKKNELSMNK